MAGAALNSAAALVVASFVPLGLVLALFGKVYRLGGRSAGDGVLAGIGVHLVLSVMLVVEVVIWFWLVFG